MYHEQCKFGRDSPVKRIIFKGLSLELWITDLGAADYGWKEDELHSFNQSKDGTLVEAEVGLSIRAEARGPARTRPAMG
nr:hypothetical protein Iba_chr06eCG1760 [Ipomoea batatas]